MSVSVASSIASSSSTASQGTSNEQDTFRVYFTRPSIDAVMDDDDRYDEDEHEEPVVFVCHHGAGYSALSFALLAKALNRLSGGKAGVLALDVRGHGECKDRSTSSAASGHVTVSNSRPLAL